MKKILLSTTLLALATMAWTRCLDAWEEPARLGQELFRFGTKGTGPSQMANVTFVALDPQGFIYAGDQELGRVQRFSPKGKLESLFYLDLEAGELFLDLAFDRAGFLYALVNRRLIRYDSATWALMGEVKLPYEPVGLPLLAGEAVTPG